MPTDPETLGHREWLGYVQPVGLVVSIPALLAAGVPVNRNSAPEHQRFLGCLPRDDDDEPIPELRDFPQFTETVLNWRPSDLVGRSDGDALPGSLEVTLPEYHETLRPTFAVREHQPKDPDRPWMMLIQLVPTTVELDEVVTADDRHWQATPHSKFERLLRETQVPTGLLSNGKLLRLVYAPRGETSGYLTFNVSEMTKVAGRPIFAAMRELLCDERLFSLGEKQRLPAILADSRKYQNTVSTELADQVLAALYELLRGFQAADDLRNREFLREVLEADPNHVYSGLLTVLMRLVFVLYAEDRGLLSSDPVFANFYSVTGLFDRLRTDAGRYPDTMDQRYGAWAQLLTLFRLIYNGGRHGQLVIPARQGYLFDPDRYNFLEGRGKLSVVGSQLLEETDAISQPTTNSQQLTTIPAVSDGVVFRVLSNLLILDGERLSYRTLDVEQIGSVYETIMGFNIEVAKGRSIAIKPKKRNGAPTTINLDELLAAKPADRGKHFADATDQKLTGQQLEAVKKAETIDDLLAALERRIARSVTPNVVAKGTMVFQPSDERRRSGSHYTPRSLTEPIVRKTLEPVLRQLSVGSSQLSAKPKGRPVSKTDNQQPATDNFSSPTPEQLLDLKICDPAMGSGAFLVEACRQVGDHLVKAWHVHGCVPKLPPDEDEVLHARRMVAQRCLYGVDKNPMAVDLAKLSLWLATLAKDHPFTFLDHCLKHGDSLVGLSRAQIIDLDWKPQPDVDWMLKSVEDRLKRATEYRQRILAARDETPYLQLKQELAVADEALSAVRLAGDIVVAAFFEGDNERKRREALARNQGCLLEWLSRASFKDYEQLTATIKRLKEGPKVISPFHWEIEFPEVFTLDASGKPIGGFDAIVGNPPFLGGTRISEVAGMPYFQWLIQAFPPCGHHCDLVAYFFRRCFSLLQRDACFGLLATNTISQGDTREGGLCEILRNNGQVFHAIRRFKWPGNAAVVVSVVHVAKSKNALPAILDETPVSRISAFLFESAHDASPHRLLTNPYFSLGCKIYGQGFLFDDGDVDCTPVSERDRLIALHPTWEGRILPYIGGEELNSDPFHRPRRFAINLSDIATENDLNQWPELRAIVEKLVKPERQRLGSNPNNIPLKRRWWAYQAHRPELYQALRSKERAICLSRVGQALAFAFLPTAMVFSEQLVVFDLNTNAAFAVLQCRVHDCWARFLSSSMKDDLRYTPSDCFETFPFPANILTSNVGHELKTDEHVRMTIDIAGRDFYDFRAALMAQNREGLTKTFNRFHDPNESSADIAKLRELHASMDRAVLEAYGWHDLAQTATCEFLLDYEDEESDEEEPTTRRARKKPWRYRWPDPFRDEVLARLLALNQERATQERLAGAAETQGRSKSGKPRKSPKAPKTAANDKENDLFSA